MRVTVYILHHNQWEYLDTAIRSVLAQTYKDIEVIFVDNNSKERSAKLNAIKDKYAFDRVLERTDSNLKRAANEVLEHCSGDFVLRLDADDFLHEAAVQLMVEKAISSKAQFVSTDYFFVDEEGKISGQFFKNSPVDFSRRPDIPMHGACCLISTAFLRDKGGYVVDVLMQDGFDIWLALGGSSNGQHINLPLFNYRRHGKNLTNDSDLLIGARRALLANHYPEVPEYSLNYFTRAPAADALLAAEKMVGAIEQFAPSSRPSRLNVFSGGDEDRTRDAEAGGRRLALIERASPEALEKNAIAACLANLAAPRACRFAVCIFDVGLLSLGIVEGALRSAVAFEADVVHSVRRETMNLYFHDGTGLKPLTESLSFTSERSIIFKRYPVCDVYRTDFLFKHLETPKTVHFLLKSNETTAEANHGWHVA